MEYRYIATTKKGDVKQDTVTASSLDSARSTLARQGLQVVSLHPVTPAADHARPKKLVSSWGRAALMDRVMMARNLSVMLRAGLPLAEALATLEEQKSAPRMRRIVQMLGADVTNGQSFSSSLARFPRDFSGIFSGMVTVGEASGTLDRNLEYVATELEHDFELQRRVRSAMIYPAIVLSATLVLGTAMTVFILPRMVSMFSTFKLALPPVTKIFLNIATFLVHYGLWVLLGLVAAVVALRVLSKLPAARPWFHRQYLRLPFFGSLIRQVNLTRVTRALSVLLKSGVTITDSLAIAAEVSRNACYQREMLQALASVQRGNSLAAALTNELTIPTMTRKMIGVGERTGKLEDSLAYLADFYEQQVNTATKDLSSVIEPALLIVIGLVMGFLAVAIISPIYQFTGSLQG
ncbi:MAG: type II secretion system F family protein [Patescibacteria group bacterium]